jgi:hypothetical protein
MSGGTFEDRFTYWNTISRDIPENIEDLTEQEKQKFLSRWKELVWTEDVQASDGMLLNIKSLPVIILEAVPKWTMDRLKDSCDHYVRGRWLSSIAVSGITAEWLTFYMFEKHVQEKGISIPDLVKYTKSLGNQNTRLLVLKALGSLGVEEFGQLDRIRYPQSTCASSSAYQEQ